MNSVMFSDRTSDIDSMHTITCTLDNLPLNKIGKIIKIDVSLSQHRRLADMGFLIGKNVLPLYKSPFDDPTAYKISGGTIALRKAVSSGISVKYISIGDGL